MWADYVMAAVLDRGAPSGRVRHFQSNAALIYRLADTVLIAAGLWLACVATEARWSGEILVAGVVGVLLFHILATVKDLYRSWRTEPVMAEIWSACEAWLVVTAVSLVVVYFQRDLVGYPPETMLTWFLATALLLGLWRAVARYGLRWARARGFNSRRLAIAGSGELGHHLARTLEECPWMGFDVVGLFDDAERGLVSGSLGEMVGLARAGHLDAIYIALPPGERERQANLLLRELSDSTTSVYLVQDRRSRAPHEAGGSRQILPDLGRVDVLQRRAINLGGIKAVSLYETPFHGPDGWVKRLEDILVGSLALALLALPMAVIAVGVKLSGPGPVLFKQRRYGLDGREIMVWKFRSMSVCEDRGAITQASKGDARVTPFGAFLRRTSLDELPQFINVLQGSMSVVGPRPHAVAHNEHYRALIGGYMLRHKVKPGITGWAQVNGWRGETESVDKMGRRVDYDLDYIRNWSIWLDIRIILMTFIKGFVHKNAY